jgi:signal transduction histidine kinase/CheY-like chemotaxis protein
VSEQTVLITEPAHLLPRAAEALTPHTHDLPFVLLFEIDLASGATTSRYAAHLDDGAAAAIEAAVRPHLGDLPRWLVLDLAGDVRLPGGVWPEPATEVFVTRVAIGGEPLGALAVFGLSPRLAFDDTYREFLLQLSSHIATARTRIEAWRTRELLLADLRAMSRTKDEFLAMLGHELRNPLSPIVTAIELMKLGGSDHAAGLQLVERQVHHLIHLVDDLLDVARITRGQLELVRVPVELGVVVARAIETASTLIESGRHVLSVEVADGLVVDGDVVRLAQVIANLLVNAAKYTPPNGHIWVDAHRDGHEAVLRVRDDGVGITPDMLDNIFDLFAQVPQDLARSQGGLGLGLSIVKMLTEKHGGTVSARSAGRGLGSEFTVRLPLATPEPSSIARAAPVAPSGRVARGSVRPRRRILIVDDNEDAAWILAETLSHIGHDVQCAHDGPSALRVALEHAPEIALLDIGLPVMDGYELATRLQAEPRISGIRLIALTGYGQAGDRQRSNDAGFAAHLVKPISLDALVAAIDVVM